MAGIEELTRRVAQLEARAEIGALIAGYGLACDEQDMATLMSLFTRDAYVGSKDGQLMRAQKTPQLVRGDAAVTTGGAVRLQLALLDPLQDR